MPHFQGNIGIAVGKFVGRLPASLVWDSSLKNVQMVTRSWDVIYGSLILKDKILISSHTFNICHLCIVPSTWFPLQISYWLRLSVNVRHREEVTNFASPVLEELLFSYFWVYSNTRRKRTVKKVYTRNLAKYAYRIKCWQITRVSNDVTTFRKMLTNFRVNGSLKISKLYTWVYL